MTAEVVRDAHGNPLTGEDGPSYLTTEEVAVRFRTSPSSVREWRHVGKGPIGVKFGRRVLYSLDEIQAWEQRQKDAAIAERSWSAS